MGVRVLYDPVDDVSVLTDSVTGWAFGPVIGEGDDGTAPHRRAEAFLTWLKPRDARELTPAGLEQAWTDYCAIEHTDDRSKP